MRTPLAAASAFARHLDLMASFTGPRIRLRPLRAEDGPALVRAAADGRLWESRHTVVPSQDSVQAYLRAALDGRAAGTMMPLAIELIHGARVVGSTRLWKLDTRNRKLEIGGTWIAASLQRSFVNTEAKYLLLHHAFEVLQAVRVQFTTDVLNQRSRQAIARLGALEEGIVRHERIMPDGRKRDSVRFSIVDDEWPAVRERLRRLLKQSYGSAVHAG